MNLLAIIKKHNLSFCIISSLVLSLIVFLFLFGPYSLNPTYTNWIYTKPYDLQHHYLGWCYFRNSPWMFPPGLFDNLSYPIETSIMNADAIPLFAIIFKLLSPILPKDFQYWGIWILFCFMLQAVLGMLIVKKYTKNDLYGYFIAVLSGLCFVLLPFMIFIAFYHSTVISHWLILASIIPIVYSEEINFRQKKIIYSVIGLLAGTINPYIVVLCGLIILSYSIYGTIKTKTLTPFGYVFMFSLFSLIAFYLVGLFSQNTDNSTFDLLENSFNLNGFYNSVGFCRFFDLKNMGGFQEQGYAYFGIGILFLIAITIFSLIIKLRKAEFIVNIKKHKKEIIAVLLLLLISIFLALSPRVTFYDKILFEIPIPSSIYNIWSIFRCTGRFIWVADYVILIVVLIYLIKNFSQKIIILLLMISVILQIVDIKPMSEQKRIPSPSKVYESVIDKYDVPIFNKLLLSENGIKYIVLDKFIYNTSNAYPGGGIMVDLPRWAKDRNIKFNYFSFARTLNYDIREKIYFYKLKNPKADELFVFYNYKFFNAATKKIPVKYYTYEYNNLLFARCVPVKGWEELEIDPKVYKKQRN